MNYADNLHEDSYECFRSPFVWLDGYSAGNHEWQTYGFRDWDFNKKPEGIADLSFERRWFQEIEDNDFEIFNPRRLPVKMKMPPGFCTDDSAYRFMIKGKWKSPIGEVSPQVIFRMNKTHEVFHWDFREGGKEKGNHTYHIWAREKRDNKTSSMVALTELGLNLRKSPNFNLTISCISFNDTPTFTAKLNYWDPSNGLARNNDSWDLVAPLDTTLNPDDVTEVELLGGMEIEYAGFTMEGCLALAPNGLVVEMKGSDCSLDRDGVCEHQSCYTTEGNECIFPFNYKDETYFNCTSVDVYQPWCATGEL